MASSGGKADPKSWPSLLTRWPAPALVVAVALLAVAVIYLELPGRPLILHSVQKLGHPLVFAFVTLGLFGVRRQRRPNGSAPGDYIPTLLVAVTLAVFTEASQVVTHRDPALKDLMLDFRGITCALALLAAYDPRLLHGHYGVYARKGLLLAAGLVVTVSLVPIGWVTAAYVNRTVMTPTVFAPRTALDLLLVSLTDMSPEIGELPTTFAREPGEKALRIPLTTRPYAGISLDEPLADWRPYQFLQIDVTNPGRAQLSLHLRIQDRQHDGNYADRFEGTEIVAGTSRRLIEIPLSRIAQAPATRTLDLEHVTGVMLYKVGSEGPREIWLSKVTLR